MQNVFTWELQDEDTADAEILTEIEGWIDEEWAPVWDLMADDGTLLYLLEVDVLTGAGLVDRNIGEEVLAHPGLSAGDALPMGAAGFIQADTERAKSFGRKYVPGLNDNVMDDGFINAINLGRLILLLGALTGNIDVGTAGVLQAGVLSRVLDSFLDFTGGGYATDVPAYQRRRKPGVGS